MKRALVALMILLLSPASWGQQPSAQEQAATEAQLAQIAEELKKREAAIGQRAERLSITERELRQLEQQMATVANELNATQQRLADIRGRINDLQQQEQELTAQLNKQRKLLEKQLDMAYRMGEHDYLKLILKQQEPAKFERLLGYYGYFNRARLQELDDIRITQEQLAQVQADVADQQQQLAQRQQQQRQQQGVLKAQQTDQQQLVKRLQREQSADQKRIQELRDNQEALEQVLAAIRAAQRDEPRLAGLTERKGKMSWPTDGKVERLFGRQRSGGVTWKGVVIKADAGEPVKAIADGRVLFANWLRGYGLVIVLDHGDGYMSLYGHNQTILPAEGDVVRANETIALVGQSGGREDPAVYFEIRVKGDAVNPVNWCR
ncbi:peptidoglycan DD-metalloendopeptidase family protein [Pseudidiomarina marina]|uniref:Peptidase M23 n=1 Tax=Pseudidiomarina marina TaxID=502366 RepID=A0A432YG47_9GAMM|nr:peptidoglycan DD-metalloendopeptidase family protein [Pseudidiomarina marina]PHR65034.1 MAG: peptidase M23 [Idiomarina sp.]RUO59927.1 peptidase M23 [Pseudidiomarina marina]